MVNIHIVTIAIITECATSTAAVESIDSRRFRDGDGQVDTQTVFGLAPQMESEQGGEACYGGNRMGKQSHGRGQ